MSDPAFICSTAMFLLSLLLSFVGYPTVLLCMEAIVRVYCIPSNEPQVVINAGLVYKPGT